MKKVFLAMLFITVFLTRSWAGDETPTVESNKHLIDVVQSHADYVWTLVAAALVFFMQAGFAMVETGFTRAKNAVTKYDPDPAAGRNDERCGRTLAQAGGYRQLHAVWISLILHKIDDAARSKLGIRYGNEYQGQN